MSSVSIPDQAGDFRLLTGPRSTLLSMPERARFLRGMSSWIGFRQVGVGYERDARQPGDEVPAVATHDPFRQRCGDVVLDDADPPRRRARLRVGAALPGRSRVDALPPTVPRGDRRGLDVAARRRPLPRRRAAAQPRHHRAVRGSHLRGGQGAAAVHVVDGSVEPGDSARDDPRARHRRRWVSRLASGRAARSGRARRRRRAAPGLRPHARWTTPRGSSTTPRPSSSSTSRPRSAASAPTARIPVATGTRT